MNLSTTKIFILTVIVFILLLVFVVGFNPFSFGEAYFRPRSSPAGIVDDYNMLPGDDFKGR